MKIKWEYSTYNVFNRFENLDIIEPLIVERFVESHTKHGEIFWKILKYNDLYTLSQPNVTEAERRELISDNNGEQGTKRLFYSPFTNDALEEQCSSVHVYIDGVEPIDHTRATIGITVQAIVHSKIDSLAGDGDSFLNPDIIDEETKVVTQYGANPNESDEEGNIIIPYKSRATVLMKCILAELNGLYLDGIGYLNVRSKDQENPWSVYTSRSNHKAFTGYDIRFTMDISGFSDDSNIGY